MAESMSNEDSDFNLFDSSEETITSSQIVIDETNNITIDQNIVNMTAEDVNIFPSLSPINEDEISIQPGNSQPSQIVNSPFVTNDFVFDGQPLELDRHCDEPAVIIQYAPSPIHLNAVGFEIELSSIIHNVTDYNHISYNMIMNHERETVAEPVQHENYAIQILNTESIPIETAESPAHIVPIDNEIHVFPIEHIDITGPTQGHNVIEVSQIQSTVIVSPVTIDSTQGDNAAEEVHQIQIMSNTNVLNSNGQLNQPENDPPITLIPPVTTPSLEVADPNSTVASVVDNTNETINFCAQIQTPMLLPRTNKRSNSSDAIDQLKKTCIPRRVKRHRRSMS
ncbi:unnamed protein product [Rotaria sordida]|uniref:Uncharacterized protein n=1 Tax=Rotaria sordida TaxID=392033 RepID=A0A813RHU7_9BILA|nr:unnamed protein product [Rotaria sordida]